MRYIEESNHFTTPRYSTTKSNKFVRMGFTIAPAGKMIDAVFDDQWNGTWYNFTDPFNSSLSDIDNTNASRHFADDPHLIDIFDVLPMSVIFIISAIPCSLIIVGGVIFWLKEYITSTEISELSASISSSSQLQRIISKYMHQRRHTRTRSRRRPRSSRAQTDDEASLGGTCRPDLLSIVQNGVVDQMMFHNGDDLNMMDTPSSIYPGDMLPNYSDSTRNLYTDIITTPLSNNSIITMIMRNNHLIIETEERVPVNCTVMTNEEFYRSNLSNNRASFVSLVADDDFQMCDTMDDDTTSCSDDNFPNLCAASHHCGAAGEERKLFHEPTTSRRADEEDQHVELFHKSILAYPRGHEQHSETDTIPSCSYDRSAERYCSHEAVHTGLTQSDLTGSSSSASRRTRIDYAYSDQCEYVSSEFPQRRRSTSLKVLTNEEHHRDTMGRSAIPSSPRRRSGASVSPDDSVQQVTDCSSPEYSEPSK